MPNAETVALALELEAQILDRLLLGPATFADLADVTRRFFPTNRQIYAIVDQLVAYGVVRRVREQWEVI